MQAIDERFQSSFGFFLSHSQFFLRLDQFFLRLGQFSQFAIRAFLGLDYFGERCLRLNEHSHALLDNLGDAIQPLVKAIHTDLGFCLAFQNELDRALDIHAVRIPCQVEKRRFGTVELASRDVEFVARASVALIDDSFASAFTGADHLLVLDLVGRLVAVDRRIDDGVVHEQHVVLRALVP